MSVQEQVSYIYANYTISYTGSNSKKLYDKCIEFNAKSKVLKYKAIHIRWYKLSKQDDSIYYAELLLIGKQSKDNENVIMMAVTQEVPADYYYDIRDNAKQLLTSLLLLSMKKIDFTQES